MHVYYSGRVQGIGFRFTAEVIARNLEVNGWVKNLDDGRVEIVAEAQEEILKNFLQQINERFKRYIRDTEVEFIEATGQFKEFGIK